MNNKAIAVVAAAVLSLSSCTFVSQLQNPAEIKGAYASTAAIKIDTPDCKLLCGRVEGESKGLSILGIPVKQPSETAAVADMYQNARKRGCKLEGESVAFANTAVERSQNFYVLWSRPALKASGDLVQYIGNGHHSH